MLERATCLLLDIDCYDRRSRRTGRHCSYGIPRFGRWHVISLAGGRMRWPIRRSRRRPGNLDDQEERKRRSCIAPCSLAVAREPSNGAECSRIVADGDPVFRSAFDGTKCRRIEGQTVASSRHIYRVSSAFGFFAITSAILISFTGVYDAENLGLF